MFPFITDADAAQAVSVVLALVILKKKYGGNYSECYLLYDVIEETKESSVKIIIAKYAYHWYNKL